MPVPVALLLMLVGAVVLWTVSLQTIDIRQITDLGLVSVFTPGMFVALVLITVSFGLSLRELNTPVLLLHVLFLIYMLYGVASMVGEEPRFSTTWVHAGFTEYIMRTGDTAEMLDARFSWPGFFALSALITDLAGYDTALKFADWASLFFNVLYLGPLLMIFRALTPNRRRVWMAVWLYTITNWVGQDYFAPQALNFFFYLAIIAVLLRWFKIYTDSRQPIDQRSWLPPAAARWLDRRFERLPEQARDFARALLAPVEPLNAPSDPLQRIGLVMIIVTVVAAMSFSHQLTPFALLFGVTALVVFSRISLRGLPLLIVIITITWLVYMTTTYLAGNLESLLSAIGSSDAVSDNYSNRLELVNHQSVERLFVLRTRTWFTLSVFGLAFLGTLRRLRKGHLDLTALLLLASPFPILGLQSYGGEALLRIFFFALPFAAFMAAGAIYTVHKNRVSALELLATVGLSLLLLGGFLIARYGNEKMDYVTHDEYAAINYLFDVAKPGSVFISASWNVPLRFRDVELYSWQFYPDQLESYEYGSIVDDLWLAAQNPDHPETYFIFSRGQQAWGELFAGLSADWQDDLEAVMLASPGGDVELIFANRDARIYRVTSTTNGDTQ
ncbi:MAG: hypothetical protein JW966_04875 [Anaerolineae bacterium]|nr:hypothetical protein [Anaerolineae bacterium]